MSYIVSVTIGRNVPGAGPMSEVQWATFCDGVVEVLTELATKRQLEATNQHQPDAFFIEQHVGSGYWDGEFEESAKMTIVSEFLITGKSDAITRIHEIAANYGQQSFALTVGESILYDCTPVYQG